MVFFTVLSTDHLIDNIDNTFRYSSSENVWKEMGCLNTGRGGACVVVVQKEEVDNNNVTVGPTPLPTDVSQSTSASTETNSNAEF